MSLCWAVLAAIGARSRAHFIDQVLNPIDAAETLLALRATRNQAIDLIVITP